MIHNDVLVSWLKLTQVKGLGPRRLMTLLSTFGTVENITSATSHELLRSRAFTEDTLRLWHALRDAASDSFLKVIEQCRERDIRITPLFSEEYPSSLRQIPSPPLTLFFSGNLELLNTPKIAIVGTRQPSEDAKIWAFQLSKKLADKGITIVSGGAFGIDTAAHKGALESQGGKTICVFGTGLSNPYPKENIPLFEQIKKTGLLVSEHLPSFPGSRIALIQRNRITSGLSNGLVLVATNERGGSMIQTKFAYEQRVPLFCPPISLNLLPNEGIKQAIRLYGATEVNSAEEIIENLQSLKIKAVQVKLNAS